MEEEIENALNLVVSTVEQSSNKRKALKEKIFQTVSTLRQLFVKLKFIGDQKLSEINNLSKKVSKLEKEIQSCGEKQAEAHQSTSVVATNEQRGPRASVRCPSSIGLTQVQAEAGVQTVSLPVDNRRRQYASVVKKAKQKRYKMTVRTRDIHQTEDIKQILKSKISPGEINVGVRTLKSLNGGVLIGTNSIEEIELLGN